MAAIQFFWGKLPYVPSYMVYTYVPLVGTLVVGLSAATALLA